MTRRRLLATLALAGSIAAGGTASAAVDVTGTWSVTINTLVGPATSRWSLEQTGTQVTLNITFLQTLSGTSGPHTGTIDVDTGAFFFDLGPWQPTPPPFPPCANSQVSGAATADGTAISGAVAIHILNPLPPGGCINAGGAFAGVRCAAGLPGCAQAGCGDGVVDLGEACDDGLLASPCCSDTCDLATAGTACTTDANACTDDVCDAAGACQHVPNTGACGSACLPGTCGGGACTPGAAAPAGTACENDDLCTLADHCDGTGVCLSGGPVSCPACEYCQPSFGCVAGARFDCQRASTSRLVLSVPSAAKRSSTWSHKDADAVPVSLFGDPTTTTSYDFCAYDQTGLVFRSTAPAGGTCGTKPCWRSNATGNAFRYRDPDGTPDGILRIALKTSSKATTVRVAGKGPNLDLPAVLDTFDAPLMIQLQARNGPSLTGCWLNSFGAAEIEATPAKLKARHQ